MNVLPKGFLAVERMINRSMIDQHIGNLRTTIEDSAMDELMVKIGKEMPESGQYSVNIKRQWHVVPDTDKVETFIATAIVKRKK